MWYIISNDIKLQEGGKSMKKRIIAAIFLAITALSLFTGCGKKVECDFCGEVKKCKTETIFGEEISICEDCNADLSGN